MRSIAIFCVIYTFITTPDVVYTNIMDARLYAGKTIRIDDSWSCNDFGAEMSMILLALN